MNNSELVKKFDTNNKQVIRKKWAKPLLAYLHSVVEKKLLYLGLPDTEALDIIEWLDYIDVVYAFQCRDYPNPSAPDQDRKNVLALESTLRRLERTRKLVTFDVFDGYIEEVLVRGYDNTPTYKEFLQNDIITIYNLDFCGQVTSPIEYVDIQGKKQQAYKFNAVDRLLNYQKNIEFPNKKFIMFLTLHCSYDGKEFENFISNPHNTDIENYITTVKSLSKGKKAPYLVKAFVYDQLSRFFTQNNFVPEFLPTIYYKGDKEHPLLFFTIIGTQVENKSGLPSPFQKLKSLLNKPFLSISDGDEFSENSSLKLNNDISIGLNVNPINIFKSSKTFKNLWKK